MEFSVSCKATGRIRKLYPFVYYPEVLECTLENNLLRPRLGVLISHIRTCFCTATEYEDSDAWGVPNHNLLPLCDYNCCSCTFVDVDFSA
jgi:hypothetical protein